MSEASWQANIDAFEQAARSMIALGGGLGPDDWGRPTECPGWSVKDQYSHILGLERWLLGDADDGVDRTTGNTQLDVDALRDTDPKQIVGDLQKVIDRRLVQLRAIDLAEVIDTPFGRAMAYGDFMRHRAFDVWMHEQDVRRAVGRPGNLKGAGADCCQAILVGALPFVVGKRAKAGPGQVVVIETPEQTWRVEVGDDHRARHGDGDGDATVRLRMAWETFVRLGGGRVAGDGAAVEITGDAELGRRVLAGMAVTP